MVGGPSRTRVSPLDGIWLAALAGCGVNILRTRCLLRASIFVSTFLVARGQKIRALTMLTFPTAWCISQTGAWFLALFTSSRSRRLAYSSCSRSRDVFSSFSCPRHLVNNHDNEFSSLSVSLDLFHARVRSSFPALGGFLRNKNVFFYPLVKLRDREVACSTCMCTKVA